MSTLNFGRQVAAIAATLLVSTACVVGAVGPATSGHTPAAMVTAARA